MTVLPVRDETLVSIVGADEVTKLTQRYKRAKNTRANWESIWQDAYDYALPQREQFFENVPGGRRTDQIFDSTGVTATQEFASRMQFGTVPGDSQWVELRSGTEIPADEAEEVDKSLQTISDDLFESLNDTNFAQEVNEAFIELAVGTGILLVEDGGIEAPFKFTAVPLTQVYLDSGPFGAIDGVFREVKVDAGQIETRWKGAKLSKDLTEAARTNPDEKILFVEAKYRDWDVVETEVYKFRVFAVKEQHIIIEKEFRGEGSDPWLVFRWSKSAGETYGRGPLLNALPDIKTLNLTVELTLENAEKAIAGMWQADDDGVLNPNTVRLVPGTIIPKAPGSAGLQPLESPGRFDISEFILSEMRHNINKAMFAETLGKPEGTPMSATEVAARQADLARTIGAPYGRIISELVKPLIRRLLFLRRAQGRIQLPRLSSRIIQIKSISPLARAADFERITNIDRFLEMMLARFGPQMLNLLVKGEETGAQLSKLFGVPETLIRTEVEQQQLAKAVAAAAQQAQQAGVDPASLIAGGGGGAGTTQGGR
jgi:hypothetical protein